MFIPWWVLYIPFVGSPDLFHRQSLLRDGDDFHDIQNTSNIDMASHRGFSRKQGCVLPVLSAKLFSEKKGAYKDCLFSLDQQTMGPPPQTNIWEVFMVNNLVFRWPKPLFFTVLGAHEMQCCNYMIWHSRSTRNHLAHQGPFCLMANWLKIANLGTTNNDL